MSLINRDLMDDFMDYSKEEFLEMYTHISEEDYNDTFVDYIKGLAKEIGTSMDKNINPDSISYILQSRNDESDVYVVMSDYDNDNAYLINIFNSQKSYPIPALEFSFCEYLYEFLEDGYELKWINEDTNPVIWEDIANGFDEEQIYGDKGIQAYIKYCKDNNITHDKVNSETFHCPDIMIYYREPNLVEDKTINRLQVLEEVRDMTLHNIACYSDGKFISKPKENFYKEWNEENQKLLIIEKMISEEKQKVQKRERER